MQSLVFLAVTLLFSFPAFAGKVDCDVLQKGPYNNTVVPEGKVVIEDHSLEHGYFTLAMVSKLKFSFFGEQTFIAKGMHFSKDTQIDFNHQTESKVRALLLVQKTPGEAYEDRFFDAVLIVTGMDMNASVDQVPMVNWRYLIMNLSCQLE